MSATANPAARAAARPAAASGAAAVGSRFYSTPLGKKAVMAVTGVILFAYLVGHALGNLQIFLGAAKINAYAEFLHTSPGLLWGARAVLLAAVILHVRAAVQLYALKSEARPVPYAKKGHRGSTLASRVMLWSGYALLAFIVYHILHFTTGTVHGNFVPGDVFHNVTTAFRMPAIAGIYVVAMALMAMHLNHGLYSFTQSLGLSHPQHQERIRVLAKVTSVALAVVFASIPIAVMAAIVGAKK